jgi:N-acetylmuramoyl-L-alanine amidase
MHKYSIITIIWNVLSVCLSANMLLAMPPVSDSTSRSGVAPLSGLPPYTIVIDPGHGGKDAGCSGKHSHEKEIVLAIGQKVRDLLQKQHPQVKVLMTRDSDVFIPLHERALKANRSKADLFISLHCNSISGRAHVHGSETYVLGLHRAEDNLAVAKRENSAILLEDNYEQNYDGFDPNSAAGHIILSMVQNAFLEQSIDLAHRIEHHLTDHAGRHSRGVKQAGFLVLRETTMPSVLVETGFLTHRSEEDFLSDEKGQWKVAQSILKAVEDYARLNAPANPEAVVSEGEPRFGLQMAVTSTPLDTQHPMRKQYSQLLEWPQGNVYKYILAAGPDRKSAERLQQKVKQDGYPDAFIIRWPKAQFAEAH